MTIEKGTDILDLADRVSKLAARSSSLELAEAVTDLRMEIVRLKEENITLREQLMASRSIDQGEDLILEDGVYWHGQRGDRGTQPICPACWDDKRKVIHMQIHRRELDHDHYRCTVCGLRVNDSQGSPARRPNVNKGGNWSP